MNPEERIIFYKQRTLGERLSAATDFIKQNWKIIGKNLLILVLPLALIYGLIMQKYMQSLFSYTTPDTTSILTMFAYGIFSWIFTSVVSGAIGAMLIRYDAEGKLDSSANLSSLFPTIMPLAGKTILISFIFSFTIMIVMAALFYLAISFGVVGAVIMGISMLLLFGVVIFILPMLTIVFFPAYFKGVNAIQSIREAFQLGLKNWGNLFVTALLVMVIVSIVSSIFSIPYSMVILFWGDVTILSFIFSFVVSLFSFMMAPFGLIYFAFQYFSIAEREEGTSLQNQLDDFDNL